MSQYVTPSNPELSRLVESLPQWAREYFEERASTYDRFCRDVHRWSERFEVSADVIEFRLYQFGRLIDSRRWKWLHAEVSLYREGYKAVDFETIAERRAQLAGWKE